MPQVPKPDNDLDRIKDYLVEASASAWHIVPAAKPDSDPFFKVMRFDGKEILRTWKEEDANFVVAVRMDVPKLIKEIEWLRAWVEDAEVLLALYDRSKEPVSTYEEAVERLEAKDA